MNLLKERREFLQMSLEEVAERAGLVKCRYKAIENEKETPTVYEAIRIAYALNGVLSDLFTPMTKEELIETACEYHRRFYDKPVKVEYLGVSLGCSENLKDELPIFTSVVFRVITENVINTTWHNLAWYYSYFRLYQKERATK